MNDIYVVVLLAGLIACMVIHRLFRYWRKADATDAAHTAMATQQRRDKTELNAKLDVVTEKLTSISTEVPGVNYFGRSTSIILAGGSEAWLV